MNDEPKKRPGIVKRSRVADQCNRSSPNANAGVFPRFNIKPTPWWRSKSEKKAEDAQ